MSSASALLASCIAVSMLLGACASSKGPARGSPGSSATSAAAAVENCASASVASELQAQRTRYYEAIERGDRAALDDMLAEGFVFVHANGSVESRAAFIERAMKIARTPAARDWRQMNFTDDDIRLHDGRVAVWVNREAVGRPKAPDALLFQTTEVLVQQGGRWRWVSVHSSKIGADAWAVPLAAPPQGCASRAPAR